MVVQVFHRYEGRGKRRSVTCTKKKRLGGRNSAHMQQSKPAPPAGERPDGKKTWTTQKSELEHVRKKNEKGDNG